MAGLAAGDAQDLRAGVGQLCLHQLDMPQKCTPGLGQLDAAAATMVELSSKITLQPMHALGETRLRHVHCLCRVAQVEPLGCREEELQLAIVHNYVPKVML